MATQLEAIFKKIEKNSKQIAIESMRSAAAKAHKLAERQARECLQKYYSSYAPKRYKRTNTLIKAIKTVKPIEKTSGSSHLLKFGIIYDSNLIKGMYESNSWYHKSGDTWISRTSEDFDENSQGNGVVQSSFVLENYLNGIHPWAQNDSWSTNEVMTQLFEEKMPGYIDSLIYQEMQKAVMSFFN